MEYISQCVIGTLAAVGLICILKTVYDIIMKDYYSADGRAELVLYGNGSDPSGMRLLCAAIQAKREIFPSLAITFMEMEEQTAGNAVENLAAQRGISYIKTDGTEQNAGNAGKDRSGTD